MLFNPEQMPMPSTEKGPEEKQKEAMRVAFETKEGEKFFAERLTSPEDPRVEKIQEMLESHFDKKEVDPIEVTKQAIRETPPYLIHVAENTKGEIKGLHASAVVETVNAKGEASEKYGAWLGCYTAVSQEERGKGIWEKLFEIQEEAAKKDAESRGIEIKGFITEAHGEAEQILNSKEVKRAYIKTKEGFRELPYEQPPLDWNPKTGKPAKDAGVVPEHLMLKLASGENKLSGKETMEIVRGMYSYNNYREEKYFKNDKAYQKHTEFVEGVEGKLADFIGRKQVHLLSREEREVMANKGIKFIEHATEKVEVLRKGIKTEGILKEVGIRKSAESIGEVQKRLEERLEKARVRGGEKLSLADKNEMTRNFYLGELGYSVKYRGLLHGKTELLDENGKAIADEKGKAFEFKTYWNLNRKETPMIDFLKEKLQEKLEGKPEKALTEEEKLEAGFQKAVKAVNNEQEVREGKISALQEAKKVGTERLSKLFEGLAYVAGFDKLAAPILREGRKLAVEGGKDLVAIGLSPAVAIEEASREITGKIQVGEALRKGILTERKIEILGRLSPEKRPEYYTELLEALNRISGRASEEMIKGYDKMYKKGKILRFLENWGGRFGKGMGERLTPKEF